MSDGYVIALDAMGGDHAPGIVVKGVDIAHLRFPEVKYLLFGDEALLAPLLAERPRLRDFCEIRHTPDAITADDKPGHALRKGRNSSMRLAIDAVRDGDADAIVSAGNTGALMAMAKFSLKTLPGIDRPALASFLPTMRGESVMLDLGANVACDSDNLVQFAVMGADFARAALGRKKPTVGLLNVGSEELKGHDVVKSANDRLREATHMPFTYEGYVEGDGIARGIVDVVVTDGFTGNVALKTTEGTAKMFESFLRSSFESSLLAKLGYLLARGGLSRLRRRFDPRLYNGAVFLGLNGICVKSHGGTDETGFANAIGVAVDLVADDLIEKLIADFRHIDEPVAAAS